MRSVIFSWQTYKKRFQPRVMSEADSLFGTKMIVDPTMKHNGFDLLMETTETHSRKYFGMAADVAKEYDDSGQPMLVIYYMWRSRDGLSRYLSVYGTKMTADLYEIATKRQIGSTKALQLRNMAKNLAEMKNVLTGE